MRLDPLHERFGVLRGHRSVLLSLGGTNCGDLTLQLLQCQLLLEQSSRNQSTWAILEPMPNELDQTTLDAWRGLLFSYARVIRRLEADMLEQHDLPITWFDVLSRLSQSPDGRLRMHELEGVSLFTRSGVTRLADRLEAVGLVRRERTPEDRRGVYLVITAAGKAKIAEVWPDHTASISDHFGRYLDAGDAESLRAVTAKILEHDEAFLRARGDDSSPPR
jgi:DNA-binding MarR family transcriptional regulator